ncbi:hypothetical protein [Photobacterium kishitanii]|uniref:Uncharacterized protein n=1 Tax=Photobacterium kishitanii TaxID=318456 RepID=A0A2T3KM39_9GAMM|nr:hypothetical protein [Photobacterium kishitanii]PSV00737.1 hypothetical protein C9J27_06235 [Photobacterium kishitanii]
MFKKTSLIIALLCLSGSVSAKPLHSQKDFLQSTVCAAGKVKYQDDYTVQCEYDSSDGSSVFSSYDGYSITTTLHPNTDGKLVPNLAFMASIETALDFNNSKHKEKILNFFQKLPLERNKEEIAKNVYGTKIDYPNKKAILLYNNYLMTVIFDS